MRPHPPAIRRRVKHTDLSKTAVAEKRRKHPDLSKTKQSILFAQEIRLNDKPLIFSGFLFAGNFQSFFSSYTKEKKKTLLTLK